jgi:hypothetical protein
MKTFKKISWALGLLSVVAVVAVFSFGSRQALAASPPDQQGAQNCTKTLQFVDIAHIKCDTGTESIIFTDVNPTDSTKSYSASVSSSGALCQKNDDVIDLDLWNSGGNFNLTDAGSTVYASPLIYYITSGKSGCTALSSNPNKFQVKNSGNIAILLKGGSDSASSLDGVSQGKSLSGLNYTRYNQGASDSSGGDALYGSGLDLSSCSGSILAVSSSGSTAKEFRVSGGGSSFNNFPELDSLPSNTSCGVDRADFGLDNSSTPRGFKISPAVSNISSSQIGNKCDPTKSAPSGYNCSCIRDEGSGETCTLVSSGATPPQGGSDNTSNTCESNFNSAFSWIVCPMLSFADSAIGFFYNQVENQLCFNTGGSSTAGSFSCGAAKDTSLADGVKEAWSIFKNIASAMLVIVMLVMVISQAIGGGPFDAYTVRKMLPKLVAAVIIMQLSWILLKFAIDLSNDAGATIGNLMMAPFGGPDHMSLGAMLGRAIDTATGSQPGNTIDLGQTTFVLLSGIAAIGIFVWAIPALPLMAMYIFVGAFIAFFTLVLRKLLIIMLVILAPLAFIAWLLPGTEKYWKLWSDNFSKLLIMFPMIMAMLSAGRIFAYITSLSGNASTMFHPHLAVAHVGFLPIPYVASATGFVNIVIVLVAFFAPYFLLPKTYSWGGQLMGQVGKAVENATSKGTEPAKKFLKTREESYRHERQRKSQERFKNDQGFSLRRPQSLWQRPIDLARAGKIDPTLGLPGSRRRKEAMTAYQAAGAESEKKEIDAANAAAQLTIERIHPDEQDAYGRALAAGQKLRIDEHGRIRAERYRRGERMANGRIAQGGELRVNDDGRIDRAEGAGQATLVERRAGLDQIARLGGEGNMDYIQRNFIRAMNSGDPEQIEMMNKFTTANVQSLFTKLPHLYKNNNFAVDGHPEQHDVIRTVEGLNPNDLTSLSGVGMRTLRDNLMTIASDRAHPRNADARAALQRLTSTFQQAAADPTLRGRIPSEVARAMQELASNNTPTPVDPAWGLGPALQDINSRVSPQGIVTDPGGGAGGGGGAPAPGGVVLPGGGAPGPVGGARPAPGQGAFIPNGEVNIPHNSPEGQIISANATDIDNYVQSVGGWGNLSDGDLMNIYHFRTGEHKARAAQQLRARNLL